MGSLKIILTHHIYLSVKCLSVRILSRAGNSGQYIFQTFSTNKHFEARKGKVAIKEF